MNAAQTALTLLKNIDNFISTDFSEGSVLEFGLFGKGSRSAKGKKPNCTPGKSWSCGYTCLPMSKKNCKAALSGQSKTYADYLSKQASASSSKSSSNKTNRVDMSKEFIKNTLGGDSKVLSGSVQDFLRDAEAIPGSKSVLKDILSAKNTATDKGGGTLDRVEILVSSYGGKFDGGKDDSRLKTNAQMSKYAQAAQTVLSRSDIPATKLGAYALGSTYQRFTEAQKNRMAYQISKGTYQVNSAQIARIPQDSVRADLISRMEKIDTAIKNQKSSGSIW